MWCRRAVMFWMVCMSVGILAGGHVAGAVQETTTTAIAQHPDQFHRAEVIVTGIASQIQTKTSPQGTPYMLFVLTDQQTGAALPVYSLGHQNLTESSRVVVQGFYYQTFTRSGDRVGNQIQAISILPARDTGSRP
ncbi:hypothetical protein [Candidatus Nitrospira bockiana]